VGGKQFFKKKAQATLIFIVTTAGQRWEVIQQNTVLNLGTAVNQTARQKGVGRMDVNRSDLEKIWDVLKRNADFHIYRDKMNAELHLAGQARFSPLTSETINAKERIENLLKENAE